MDWLTQIAIAITLYIQNLGDWLVWPMRGFSFLGQEQFFLLVMPALYWCIDAIFGLRIGMMLLLTSGINAFFKLMFHTGRPYWIDPRVRAYVTESSFGIPSGHSQTAASVWGLVASSFRRRWFVAMMIFLIFAIGLSRIYLGAHFITDVLAGWTFGAILVYAFLRLERPVVAWFKTYPFRLQIIILFLSSLVLIVLTLLPLRLLASYQVPAEWLQNIERIEPGKVVNPLDPTSAFTLAGTWFGMTVGVAWLFNRHGGFDASGDVWRRALRYFVGVAGVLVLYMGLGAIFPRDLGTVSYLLRFVRYALIGIWVSAWAPLLFFKMGIANPVIANRHSEALEKRL